MREKGVDEMDLLAVQIQRGMEEVRACNAYSGEYGLMLRESEIRELVAGRKQALIEQFFRQYDLYFFAHRTPLDFGLPLWSAANSGLRGISCVEQCLKECICGLAQS